LQLLRREGYLAAVAEKWNPHSRSRADLFGFADVLAVRAGAPVLAVQATSASNHSARVRKAQALPALRTRLAAGCAFEPRTFWKAAPPHSRRQGHLSPARRSSQRTPPQLRLKTPKTSSSLVVARLPMTLTCVPAAVAPETT
jgi:hypothetical protein